MYVSFLEIIDKKVHRVVGDYERSYTGRKTKQVNSEYVLFEDGETFLSIEEQDYHAYHDCSSSARQLQLQRDKRLWKLYDELPDATKGDFY